MSSRTVVDHYQYLRDICSWKTPIELGGSDKEVQIDESLLVGAKYQQGCNLYRPQIWIFRDYGVVRKVGYVTYVKKRVVATLLPIIERVILPGSTVISDKWRAYAGIPKLLGNCQHLTVSHSQNLVDPVQRKYTNNMESYWVLVKTSFRKTNGT